MFQQTRGSLCRSLRISEDPLRGQEIGQKGIATLLRMSSEDGGSWQGWKEDVGLRNIRYRVKAIKFGDLLVRVEKVLENLMSSSAPSTLAHSAGGVLN